LGAFSRRSAVRLAIIGTGKMATGLARGWLKASHGVTFGSRDPAGRRDLLFKEVGPEVRVETHAVALDSAECVVLALPYAEVEPFSARYAVLLRGRVVMDITNPFGPLPDNRTSGPEVTARAIGDGARVVAAFKTNFSGVLAHPVDAAGTVRDVFYCGDDAPAKAVVRGLIEALGFRAVDCGPLLAARVLDGMVPLMVEMDRRLGGPGRTRRGHWKFETP
jgi:predicted dinucleotide-binding enzyme